MSDTFKPKPERGDEVGGVEPYPPNHNPDSPFAGFRGVTNYDLGFAQGSSFVNRPENAFGDALSSSLGEALKPEQTKPGLVGGIELDSNKFFEPNRFDHFNFERPNYDVNLPRDNDHFRLANLNTLPSTENNDAYASAENATISTGGAGGAVGMIGMSIMGQIGNLRGPALAPLNEFASGSRNSKAQENFNSYMDNVVYPSLPNGYNPNARFVDQMQYFSNKFHFQEGYFAKSWNSANDSYRNSSRFSMESMGYGLLGTMLTPMALLEESVRGTANIPSAAFGAFPAAEQGGTNIGIMLDSSLPTDQRVSAWITANGNFAGAFLGLAAPAALTKSGINTLNIEDGIAIGRLGETTEIQALPRYARARPKTEAEVVGRFDPDFANLGLQQKVEVAFQRIEGTFGKKYANGIRQKFDQLSLQGFQSPDDLGIFLATPNANTIKLNTNIGNAEVFANTLLHEVRHFRHHEKLNISVSKWNKLPDAFVERYATSTNIWQGKRLGLSNEDLGIFIQYYNRWR